MQGTFVMVKRLTSIYKEKVIGSSPILAVSGSSMGRAQASLNDFQELGWSVMDKRLTS